MKTIVGAVVLSALSFLPASAATLDGDAIQVSYVLNGTSKIFGTFTPPKSGIIVPKDPMGMGSIIDDTLSYTFGREVSFDALSLTSVTFTDENAAKTITGVTLGTDTVSGLTSGALSFTPDAFTVDLTGVTAAAGDAVSFVVAVSGGTVSAVPLPASAPLFGGALLGLGVLGYTLRRKASATAA